jgi:hypothetical protein
MSANIRIESGIAAGTNYWIDRPVLRIGSDPTCEICLPTAELPLHALTLEFRNGAYKAYNRSASPLTLGSAAIQPGTAGAWDDGDMLILPGDQRLVLAIDGYPRPCPRPERQSETGLADETTASTGDESTTSPEATTKGKSKNLMQMAVIALCVVVGGGLLLLNNMGGLATAPAVDRPTFDSIVHDSLKKDATIRALVQKLQYAQSFVVRGNTDAAKEYFGNLRDQLLHEGDSLPAADRDDAKVIREYVIDQLGQLQ